MLVPRSRRRSAVFLRVLSWLLVLFSGLWLATNLLLRPVGPLDEPVLLLGARLTLEGAMPHRDFWSMYPSLRYHLLAGLFRLAAPSVVVGRLFHLALLGLALGALWRRPQGGGGRARGALYLLVLLAALGPLPAALWWGAAVPAVLALRVYGGAASPGVGRCLAAGGLAAWALLSKLNFGLYALGALVCGEGLARPRRWTGMLLVGLPAAFALLVYGWLHRDHLAALADQILLFPALRLEPHRVLSLPPGPAGLFGGLAVAGPLFWLGLRGCGGPRRRQAALVLLVGGVFAGLVVLVGRSLPALLPRAFLPLFLAFLLSRLLLGPLPRGEAAWLAALTLFSHYFLSRADRWHYGVLVPLWWGLLTAAPWGTPLRGRFVRAALLLVPLFSLPVLRLYEGFLPPRPELGRETAALFAPGGLLARGDASYLAAAPRPLPPPAARLFANRDELRAVRFVRRRTAPGTPVYVGVEEHGRVFLSPTRTYWILGRPPGVHHHMLEPGLTTTAAVQRRMIADLEERGVDWVILRRNVPGDPDFQRRAYRGAELLDRYLREHFREAARFGAYRVLQRVL